MNEHGKTSVNFKCFYKKRVRAIISKMFEKLR